MVLQALSPLYLCIYLASVGFAMLSGGGQILYCRDISSSVRGQSLHMHEIGDTHGI